MKTNIDHLTAFRNLLLAGIFLVSSSLYAQNILKPICYGGNRMLREFIKEEMVYPQKAILEQTEGPVVISFMVHKDGSTSDYKVRQSLSKETDEEALRICRLIFWYPATEIGRPVDFTHELEFKFDIKKYQNQVKSRGYDQIIYPYTPIDSGYAAFSMLESDVWPKPVYSSKDYNFSNFISNHLTYPEAAFKQNISGTVKLKFVVEPSGRISNILTEQALGGGCTEEAIRVVKLIKWNPGILQNKAVRTWMCLEITFDIAKRSVNGTIPDPGQVH
jgi:TonB family protein